MDGSGFTIKRYPAPWHQTANGFVLLYHFPGRMPAAPFFGGSLPGYEKVTGPGALVLADYTRSNAGPYREILFIPGRFRYRRKHGYSITRIFVSTMESVFNGQKNWGIPKDSADFTIHPLKQKRTRYIVKKKDTLIADITMKKWGPAVPVSTFIYPVPLLQTHEGRWYLSRFWGKGNCRFAGLESIRINPELFPDFTAFKPIAAFAVENFRIRFSKARIKKMAFS